MSKEDFIKNVKGWTEKEMTKINSEYPWKHYSDESWGEIYDLGDIHFTDKLIIRDKHSMIRKTSGSDKEFVEDIKRQMEGYKKRGFNVEFYINGAVILEGIAYNPDGKNGDGGYIRYIIVKKDE